MGILNNILKGNYKKGISNEINDSVEKGQIGRHNYFLKKYDQMEKEGKVIDKYYVMETKKVEFPYPCATELEYDKFTSLQEPLNKGEVVSILNILHSYSEGLGNDCHESEYIIHKDFDKVEYWKRFLVEGAENGNRMYQAALITDAFFSHLWNSDDEKKIYKEKYEKKLYDDAENGNAYAQMAIAVTCLGTVKYGSDEAIELLEKASNSGVGDAYYYLVRALDAKLFKENLLPVYGDERYCRNYRLHLKGADINNGIFAGNQQDMVGDAYRDGECGFEKDIEKARHYYKLAVSNGYRLSEWSLKNL